MQHGCIILRPIYKILPLDSVEIVSHEKDLKTKRNKNKSTKPQLKHYLNTLFFLFPLFPFFFFLFSLCLNLRFPIRKEEEEIKTFSKLLKKTQANN